MNILLEEDIVQIGCVGTVKRENGIFKFRFSYLIRYQVLLTPVFDTSLYLPGQDKGTALLPVQP
jgi:hypothetical protein